METGLKEQYSEKKDAERRVREGDGKTKQMEREQRKT